MTGRVLEVGGDGCSTMLMYLRPLNLFSQKREAGVGGHAQACPLHAAARPASLPPTAQCLVC